MAFLDPCTNIPSLIPMKKSQVFPCHSHLIPFLILVIKIVISSHSRDVSIQIQGDSNRRKIAEKIKLIYYKNIKQFSKSLQIGNQIFLCSMCLARSACISAIISISVTKFSIACSKFYSFINNFLSSGACQTTCQTIAIKMHMEMILILNTVDSLL